MTKKKPLPFKLVQKWGTLYKDLKAVGDRWTFVLHADRTGAEMSFLGMNDVPFHPSYGIAMHGPVSGRWLDENRANRVGTPSKWSRVPLDVRLCVSEEIRATANDVLRAALKRENTDPGRGEDFLAVHIVRPDLNPDAVFDTVEPVFDVTDDGDIDFQFYAVRTSIAVGSRIF